MHQETHLSMKTLAPMFPARFLSWNLFVGGLDASDDTRLREQAKVVAGLEPDFVFDGHHRCGGQAAKAASWSAGPR